MSLLCPLRAAVVAFGLALLVAGCARPHAASPTGATASYAAALDEGRYEDAYRLLSSETRSALTYDAFVELLESHPDEVADLVEQLKRQEPRDGRVRARVESPDGDVLELVYEDGGWKLGASAVEAYPQTAPLTALQSFVRAYDAKRWDVLLRFVPSDQSEGLSAEVLEKAWTGEQAEEIDGIVEGLRASFGAPEVEHLGDRATMSYAGGGMVELVLEGGQWKIEDFRR